MSFLKREHASWQVSAAGCLSSRCFCKELARQPGNPDLAAGRGWTRLDIGLCKGGRGAQAVKGLLTPSETGASTALVWVAWYS